jgi:hypothetical protein
MRPQLARIGLPVLLLLLLSGCGGGGQARPHRPDRSRFLPGRGAER